MPITEYISIDRVLAATRNFLKPHHPDAVFCQMRLDHEQSILGGDGDLFILRYPCTRAQAKAFERYTVVFKCGFDQHFRVDGLKFLIGDGDDPQSVQYDPVRRQVNIWVRTWYTDEFQAEDEEQR